MQTTDSEGSSDEAAAVTASASMADVQDTIEADNIVPLTPKREREAMQTRSMVRPSVRRVWL